jgi:hypothetical protein
MSRASQRLQDCARECVRLAGLPTVPPEIREELFRMAREWIQVAMDQEDTDEKETTCRRRRVRGSRGGMGRCSTREPPR